MKNVLSILCLCCYLISGNIFAHAASMNNMHMGEADSEMKMSDCGMMEKSSIIDSNLDDCFEKCFGIYDDISSVEFSILSTEKQYACAQELFPQVDTNNNKINNFLLDAPPDDRCLKYSKNTPYFSHNDTTQIE